MTEFEGLLPATPAVIRRIPGLTQALGLTSQSLSRRALFKAVAHSTDLGREHQEPVPVPITISSDTESLSIRLDMDLPEAARQFAIAVLQDQYVPVLVRRSGRIARSLLERQLGIIKRDPRVLPGRYLAAQNALAFTIEPTAVVGRPDDDWAVALFYMSQGVAYANVPTQETLLLVFRNGTARLLARPAQGLIAGATGREDLEHRIRAAVPEFKQVACYSQPGFGLYELPEVVRLVTALPYDETDDLGRLLIEVGDRKARRGSNGYQIGKAIMHKRLRRCEMRAYGLLLKAAPDRLYEAMTALIRQKGNQPQKRVPGSDGEINADVDLLVRLALWLGNHTVEDAQRIQKAVPEMPAAFAVPATVPKARALGNVVSEYGALLSTNASEVEFPFTTREAIKALSLAVPFASAFHQVRSPEQIIDYIEVLSLLRRHQHHVRPCSIADVKRLMVLKYECPISSRSYLRAVALMNQTALYGMNAPQAAKERQILTRHQALVDRRTGGTAPMPMGLIDVHTWLQECFKMLPGRSRIPLARLEHTRIAGCLAEYALLSQARHNGVAALRKLDRLWHRNINRILDQEEDIRLSVLGLIDGGRRERLYPAVPFELPVGVVQIRKTSGLQAEGRAMDNCVRTYDIAAAAADCIILSVITSAGRSTAEIRVRPVYEGHKVTDFQFALAQHEARSRRRPHKVNEALVRDMLKRWNRNDDATHRMRAQYEELRNQAFEAQQSIEEAMQRQMTPEQKASYAEQLLPLLRPYLPKAYRKLGPNDLLVAIAQDLGLQTVPADELNVSLHWISDPYKERGQRAIEWDYEDPNPQNYPHRPSTHDRGQVIPF